MSAVAFTHAPSVSLWREPTRIQWLTFLAAWFGWILDAFDFTIFLLAMPYIQKKFGVSMTATAGVITLTLVLRMAGGVAAGAASDKWGRKWPLMISIVWFALCDGAVAIAPTFLWIVILRMAFGFGMGAEWASGATLAMENWPKRSRGIASGVLQGSWAIGYLLAAVVAGVVLPRWGYKPLFAIAVLPALLVIPIRLLLPDSKPERESDVPAASQRGGLTRTIMWACVVVGAAFAAYYGLTALYPTMLMKTLGLSAQAMSGNVAWFNVGMLVGSAVCGYVAMKKGPMVALFVPMLITLPVLPVYLGLTAAPLWLGAILGGMFGAGYVGVTPLLLTAMFPPEYRGRAVGFVYHVGACMAAVVPPLITSMTERGGIPLNLAIAYVTGGSLVVTMLLLFFRPRDIFDEPPAPSAISLSPVSTGPNQGAVL